VRLESRSFAPRKNKHAGMCKRRRSSGGAGKWLPAEEVQQADHNLSEARATAANDKSRSKRTKDLFRQGVSSNRRSTTPRPSTSPANSA